MSANVILHRKQILRGVFLLRLILFWVEYYVGLMSYWPSRQIFNLSFHVPDFRLNSSSNSICNVIRFDSSSNTPTGTLVHVSCNHVPTFSPFRAFILHVSLLYRLLFVLKCDQNATYWPKFHVRFRSSRFMSLCACCYRFIYCVRFRFRFVLSAARPSST